MPGCLLFAHIVRQIRLIHRLAKSRGERAPVPHSWWRHWSLTIDQLNVKVLFIAAYFESSIPIYSILSEAVGTDLSHNPPSQQLRKRHVAAHTALICSETDGCHVSEWFCRWLTPTSSLTVSASWRSPPQTSKSPYILRPPTEQSATV